MYVLTYENEEDRSSFSKYYTPTLGITDYNVLIDQQPFLNYQSKIKKKVMKKLLNEVLNDYTTGNVLDYDYFLNLYELIAIDLSQQSVNLTRQRINFVGKLSQNATIFFIIEMTQKTKLTFKQNSVDIS